jgi:hypothetical protein
LAISSPEGYRAELWVDRRDGRALPGRIESPYLLPEDRLRRNLGVDGALRRVRFLEFRPSGGRLVPGRIRFEDPFNPFELELEEVELNPPGAEDSFRD